MKGQVLKPTMSIVIAVIGMLSIMIALGIFLFVQFILGGASAEIVGIEDRSYHVSEVLATYPFQDKKILEPVLQAAIIKRLDEKTKTALSSELDKFLGKYDFDYEVSLPFSEAEPPKCTPFSNDHKAVDISAGCGTPVKAICDGRLSTIGPGLSDDKVFGGTISGGQKGLQLKHDKTCDYKPDYRSLYGCIEILNEKGRDVKKGEIIGYVSTCGAEKEAGCHLHFAVTKGAIKDEEDPQMCGSIDFLLGKQTNLLAKKGDFLEADNVQEFSVPLLFKDKLEQMVVKIG